MAHMPTEPEAFAEQVVFMLKRAWPDHEVELTGPHELIIDGRRLDLENLYRLVAHDTDRGVEIVENYLDQLLAAESMSLSNISFDFARPRIMPRIQPVSLFEKLDASQVAHTPFVNDTVIVFVIDLPQMTISITTEQTVRWGVTTEELDDIARANLMEQTQMFQPQVVESGDGGRAAIISEHDGYDASRLLLPNLRARLGRLMGGDFLVATPARDMFVALTAGPNDFVERLRERVEEDFGRLPYPITPSLFYVCHDGVAGTLDIAA